MAQYQDNASNIHLRAEYSSNLAGLGMCMTGSCVLLMRLNPAVNILKEG